MENDDSEFITARHAAKRLKKRDFELLVLIIPNRHVGSIGVGFLKRLLRQAGLNEEEWKET